MSIFMHSVHEVPEMNAYRRDCVFSSVSPHVYIHIRVYCWTDSDETWC